MNTFPSTLTPKQQKDFKVKYYEYVVAKLREAAYEHILSGNSSDFLDLSQFKFTNYPDLQIAVDLVTKELESLGWAVTLTYGKTALFVYPPDNVPSFW